MAVKFGRPLERKIGFVPVEAEHGEVARNPLDLTVRMRRNRQHDWTRRMVREATLTADDLIWPLFVMDGDKARQPVPSMPGVERLSVDQAVREAARAAELAIPCIALFPYTDPSALRDETGSEALNPGQSRLSRHPRHQEGGAGGRRLVRRGARSLHQPRP